MFNSEQGIISCISLAWNLGKKTWVSLNLHQIKRESLFLRDWREGAALSGCIKISAEVATLDGSNVCIAMHVITLLHYSTRGLEDSSYKVAIAIT